MSRRKLSEDEIRESLAGLDGWKADGGWLTLAGLFWLKEGPNRFGTDPSSDFVLPPGTAPARADALTQVKAGAFSRRCASASMR